MTRTFAVVAILLSTLAGAARAEVDQCWAQGGAPNHCDPLADQRYDIWQRNCHTAANVAVCANPDTTGVMICGGRPDGPNNPGNHTFSYQLNANGTTTYWNWGISCGPCAGNPNDNIGAGNCHDACIRRFCGNQYENGAEVRCLAPGQMVEIPGPSACVRETARGGNFDPLLYGACSTCCDSRADRWPNTPGYCARGRDSEDFRAACKYLCGGFFLNNSGNGMPATCPYRPSVMACSGGQATALRDIEAQCGRVGYANPRGNPTERRCFFDCVNNTRAAQVNCGGAPAGGVPVRPGVPAPLQEVNAIAVPLE